MTPEEYRTLRRRLGSQAAVAKRLGVHVQTIKRRELNQLPINTEAALAIRHLRKED